MVDVAPGSLGPASATIAHGQPNKSSQLQPNEVIRLTNGRRRAALGLVTKPRSVVAEVLDMADAGPKERRLTRAQDLSAVEYREEQRKKLQRVLTSLADRLEKEVANLPTTSLAINIGILSDKLQALDAVSPAPIANQTNIQINGLDRASIVTLLKGGKLKKAEQVKGGKDGAKEGRNECSSFANEHSSTLNRQKPAPPPPPVGPVDAT